MRSAPATNEVFALSFMFSLAPKHRLSAPAFSLLTSRGLMHPGRQRKHRNDFNGCSSPEQVSTRPGNGRIPQIASTSVYAHVVVR